MQIITKSIATEDLKQMAIHFGGDMVKAVVDIEREVVAVDAELHSDLEAFLLDDGSKQKNLWGINFYPDKSDDSFVEFDSLINVRPSQGNRSRDVTDVTVRNKITEVIAKRVKR